MGLLSKIKGKLREKKKVQAAYEKGQAFGSDLVEKIEAFSNSRFSTVTVNLIEAFKQRLDTVYDDAEHDPEVIAAAELEIFSEQIQKYHKDMWQEVQDYLAQEIQVAEVAGEELVEKVADLIENTIEENTNVLITSAKTLYDAKLNEIKDKKET